MRMPTLCHACYTHYRSTVVNACPFCRDAHFPEQVLCDLVREGRARSSLFVVQLFDQRWLSCSLTRRTYSPWKKAAQTR